MRVAVGDELPFAVFVLHHAVAVVHGVVADRDQAVHDEDDNEIEAEFLPETSTVPTTFKKSTENPSGAERKAGYREDRAEPRLFLLALRLQTRGFEYGMGWTPSD